MKSKGFTLIEILLSIAVIAVLSAIVMPVLFRLFPVNDLDVAKNQIAQSLNRAAFLSSASDGDSVWGVEILSGNVTVFKGANYAGRDTNYDEIFPIASSVTPSGLSEIVFNKMTGTPAVTGTITLTSSTGETRTITINTKGAVSY